MRHNRPQNRTRRTAYAGPPHARSLGKTSLAIRQEARMSAANARAVTRGVVFVHSTPAALCPHIGWALESVLGAAAPIEWIKQPVAPGTLRTELSWMGEPGTGAKLASALRGWADVRYEVTEEPSPGCDGSR